MEHFFRAGRVLDDGSLRRKVSAQNSDAAVRSDRLVIRADNIFFCNRSSIPLIEFCEPSAALLIKSIFTKFRQIFTQCLSGHRHHIEMQMIFDFFHNRRNAARIIEALCRPSSCRADIEQIPRIAVQTIECVAGDLDAELMRNGRDVQQTVCASRNCRVDKNRILKTLFRHKIAWPHMLHLCQFYRLAACLPCICQKIRACRRHQSASRQGKAECLRHDLHRGCRSDKRTGTAARAGIAFRPVELLLVDLTALKFCAVHAKLLQCQHLRSRIHRSARHNNRRNIDTRKADQIARHTLVAARQIDAAVKRCRIRVDLDHIGDHLAARKTVVDAVRSLALAVTDVGAEIPRPEAPRFRNAFPHFLDQQI